MAGKYSSVLSQAHILVLGGSSGIGFCVAEHALTTGASVVVASSRQAKVDTATAKLLKSVPEASDRLQGHVCDLGDIESIRPNLERLLQAATQTRQLDHIVFTAGNPISTRPIAELGLDRIKDMGNVRFFAPLLLGGIAPKYMRQSHKSSITLTSGTMTHRPMKNWTSTVAYGSGTEGIMRGLAMDLAPVRVNLVSPGAIRTEMFDEIPPERLDGILQMYKDTGLTNTVGTPEEASEAYMYAMRCSFATGTVIPVDGGRLLK